MAAQMTPKQTAQHWIDVFEARVDVECERGKSRSEAVKAVVRADAALHRRYLYGVNFLVGRVKACENIVKADTLAMQG